MTASLHPGGDRRAHPAICGIACSRSRRSTTFDASPMNVVSACPLRVTSLLWQARHGVWFLTAIAKATFVLAPVESALGEEQEYPNEDENHWNDDPGRSLYSPSDLVPFKPAP